MSLIAAGIIKGNKRVLGPYSCYGSTYTILKSRFADVANCEFVDMGDTEAALSHIRSLKPDILYMETSSNPLTVITDLLTLSRAAKEANPSAITIVDNTFATPLLVRPLSLGVDVVVHSLTKYINGHGDVLGGIVLSNSDAYIRELREVAIEFGSCLSPWDAWLVLRGLRTLSVRLRGISETALSVAKFLASHRHVRRLWYPGLPSHPQFSTVVQMRCGPSVTEEEIRHGFPFSGMISIDLNSSPENCEAAKVFIDSLKVFSNQVSLGDYKSLASCPGLSTQHQVSPEDREKTRISGNTIRLSIGLENPKDLCDDLEQALEKMSSLVEVENDNKVLQVVDNIKQLELQDPMFLVDTKKAFVDDCVPRSIAVTVPSSERGQCLQRLKVLVSQMNSINSEIESLQNFIKKDNESIQATLIA